MSVVMHCDRCRRTWHDGDEEDQAHASTFPYCPHADGLRAWRGIGYALLITLLVCIAVFAWYWTRHAH